MWPDRPPSALDGRSQYPHPCGRQSVGRPLRRNRKVAGEESPGSADKRCRITSGGCEPRDSATENIPPWQANLAAVRVKWCGKSAPRRQQRRRQGKPHREQDRIGTARGWRESAASGLCPDPAVRVGCLRRRATGVPEEWPSRRRILSHAVQNPAYRPADLRIRALGGNPAERPPILQPTLARLLNELAGKAQEATTAFGRRYRRNDRHSLRDRVNSSKDWS